MSRQPDFSTAPRRRRVSAWEVGLLVAGSLALLLALRSATSTRAAGEHARGRLLELRRESEAVRRRVGALEAKTGAAEGLLARAALNAGAPPARVLAELAEALPPGVRLAGLTLTYGVGIELDMEVVARSPRAYDLFLERLAADPRIREVTPGAESREGEVRTTVRVRYVGEAT